MKMIYKYPITVADRFALSMPQGAQVLTVQSQREVPCIWALVDPSEPEGLYEFALVGTGHKREDLDGMPYLGTVQLLGGDLIFHVFGPANS